MMFLCLGVRERKDSKLVVSRVNNYKAICFEEDHITDAVNTRVNDRLVFLL